MTEVILERKERIDFLYENYGKISDSTISELLKTIIPILKDKEGNLYKLSLETEKEVIEKLRGYAFTNGEFGEKIIEILVPFAQINVLVQSASPWTLQPDVGEVFDQMTEDELKTTKAFWLDIRLDEEETFSTGVYECTLYK
jgi:hypothetical protein